MPLVGTTKIDDRLLKRSTYQYAQTNGSAPTPLINNVFVYPTSTLEESFDFNSGAEMPSIRTDYVYEPTVGRRQTGDPSRIVFIDSLRQFGDPTRITTTVSQSGSEQSRKTVSDQYKPANLDRWILGRLERSTVTSSQIANPYPLAATAALPGNTPGAPATGPTPLPSNITAATAPVLAIITQFLLSD